VKKVGWILPFFLHLFIQLIFLRFTCSQLSSPPIEKYFSSFLLSVLLFFFSSFSLSLFTLLYFVHSSFYFIFISELVWFVLEFDERKQNHFVYTRSFYTSSCCLEFERGYPIIRNTHLRELHLVSNHPSSHNLSIRSSRIRRE